MIEGHAPGEEPYEVQQPEPESRDGVVVARIAQVQEAEEVLIEKVEPEKAVILAGAAVHGPVEVRRVAKGRENVPRRGDKKEQRMPEIGRRRFQDCLNGGFARDQRDRWRRWRSERRLRSVP